MGLDFCKSRGGIRMHKRRMRDPIAGPVDRVYYNTETEDWWYMGMFDSIETGPFATKEEAEAEWHAEFYGDYND